MLVDEQGRIQIAHADIDWVQDPRPVLHPWDFGNKVLYDLCREHPGHDDESVIIAKIWLIGRAYAAAIERRREKTEGQISDNFYVSTVAPAIRKSRIDDWLADVLSVQGNRPSMLSRAVETHGRVVALFQKITGLEKRSLASKYLHFHCPNAFYIYDSRAATVMPKLVRKRDVTVVLKAGKPDWLYRDFCERAETLRQQIEASFHVSLCPRDIDKLLLQASELMRRPSRKQ